jgi:3-phenylpropionate/trans-cinnamate dioxygenase ferredoxin reductase component
VRADERIVIVGGGASAVATAEAYRKHGGSASVLMLCGEPERPYERPPLSKEFLRGESMREDLAMRSPEWYADRGIELRLGVRASGLDVDSGEVEGEDGSRIGFDACVLATGSRPLVPDFIPADLEPVNTIRQIADSERLRDRAPRDERLVVVGSGFIGCEAAISLARTGAKVSMITMERLPQVERLGEEAATRIRDWLEAEGVEFHGEAELERLEPWARGLMVTAGLVEVTAARVVIALGIQRNTEIAAAAGLELLDDTICTDSAMRTSKPSVLAVGDIAAAVNESAGRRLKVEHWGEALNHGAAAGATLAGVDEPWGAAPGFWSALGDRTLKHVAWGDGFDSATLEKRDGDAFSVRYERDGELVGLLAHDADDAYDSAREHLERSR